MSRIRKPKTGGGTVARSMNRGNTSIGNAVSSGGGGEPEGNNAPVEKPRKEGKIDIYGKEHVYEGLEQASAEGFYEDMKDMGFDMVVERTDENGNVILKDSYEDSNGWYNKDVGDGVVIWVQHNVEDHDTSWRSDDVPRRNVGRKFTTSVTQNRDKDVRGEVPGHKGPKGGTVPMGERSETWDNVKSRVAGAAQWFFEDAIEEGEISGISEKTKKNVKSFGKHVAANETRDY